MTSGLAVLAALVAGAAPARAQDTAPAVDPTAVHGNTNALVERALDRAAARIDEALALRDVSPAGPAEPHVEQSESTAEPDAAEPQAVRPPVSGVPRTRATTPPAPTGRVTPPAPGPERASAPPAPPAGEAPAPPAYADPQPAVEPEGRGGPAAAPERPGGGRRSGGSGGRARVGRALETRVRAVEDGIGTVRRQLAAGAPAPGALRELRGRVERLRTALAGRPPPSGALGSRIALARAAAGELAAALERHGAATPAAKALLGELLALSAGRAADVPVGANGRRPHPRGAAHRPARGAAPAAVAYTHAQAPPARSQTGSAAATARARGRPAQNAAPPRQPPGPAGPGAAVSSAAIFSVAGPAVLALLLGLAIPRVLRRLSHLPVCRPPEWVASPPERPG